MTQKKITQKQQMKLALEALERAIEIERAIKNEPKGDERIPYEPCKYGFTLLELTNSPGCHTCIYRKGLHRKKKVCPGLVPIT